ncbi:phosphoribosyltransferase [Candidatus Peregrinibacteria bacterium]|nr:phosphoribosyltransferase [Candidatus Peregrinibacteria bacterium]
MYFENREEAGIKLAQEIIKKIPDLKSNPDVVILALPRGGVPVAYEIAKILKAPMDLILTHKLGAPENSEFAIGAVAEDGSSFLDKESCSGISNSYIKEEIVRQLKEIKHRIEKYREGKPLTKLQGKIVILVDDGIATGNTMKAAIALAKNAKAKKIIVAVPVLPSEILGSLKKEAEVVYLDTPFPFFAIGRFYNNFSQLTDDEVKNYLASK